MTCRAQISRKDSGSTNPPSGHSCQNAQDDIPPPILPPPDCHLNTPLQVSRLLWTHSALPATHRALHQTLKTLASFPTAWLQGCVCPLPSPSQSTGTTSTSSAPSEGLYSICHSKTRNTKLVKSDQSRRETRMQEILESGSSNTISCMNNQVSLFYIWKTHSWKMCSSATEVSYSLSSFNLLLLTQTKFQS